jgi:hypothetical protein
MSESALPRSPRRRIRADAFAEATIPYSDESSGPPHRRERPGSRDDLVQIFMTRANRALARIAERMPREHLVEALSTGTDTEVLFRSLHDAAAIGAEIEGSDFDPLTAALLRGAQAKREMLKAEGGVLTAAQLADHLGITPQGLGKKRDKNQVFWLDIGDGYVYPTFQIDPTGLLPGIGAILAAFRIDDPWMRVHFMLTGDNRLGGRRPLDALRAGEIDTVAKAAAAPAFRSVAIGGSADGAIITTGDKNRIGKIAD